MKNIREFDTCGRIHIPVEIRRKLINNGNGKIEVICEPDAVILVSAQSECAFCNSTDNLVEFKSKLVCESCISELWQCLHLMCKQNCKG